MSMFDELWKHHNNTTCTNSVNLYIIEAGRYSEEEEEEEQEEK